MNYCSEMPQNRAPIIVIREIVAATRTQWHGYERNDSEVRGQAVEAKLPLLDIYY